MPPTSQADRPEPAAPSLRGVEQAVLSAEPWETVAFSSALSADVVRDNAVCLEEGARGPVPTFADTAAPVVPLLATGNAWGGPGNCIDDGAVCLSTPSCRAPLRRLQTEAALQRAIDDPEVCEMPVPDGQDGTPRLTPREHFGYLYLAGARASVIAGVPEHDGEEECWADRTQVERRSEFNDESIWFGVQTAERTGMIEAIRESECYTWFPPTRFDTAVGYCVEGE